MQRMPGQPLPGAGEDFEFALAQIAARAAELDADPRFPSENFESLKAAGIPQLASDRQQSDLAREISVIRALAAADASTARILDGHFNGVERLALGAPHELRERELSQIADGELLVGVWGADPVPGEGPPASIVAGPGARQMLRGVKTFCSGAGGVQRALVIARDETGSRRLVYLDVTSAVLVDRSWYRASGLRASESHRVEFHDTPILAILGGADEATREPWFARDAVRTASTWAGIADCVLHAAVASVSERSLDDLQLQSIGRMRVAQSSIDRWLGHSIAALQRPDIARQPGSEAIQHEPQADGAARALAAECRLALADAARTIAAEAVRVSGSRVLVLGGTLDRARRDLDLFLLQHRLDPKLVELGTRTLEEDRR
jgi:alkylation response protein AidB-like acyl-CoA dehydrogenase